MSKNTFSTRRALLSAAALALCAPVAMAQGDKPVRFLLAVSAGSAIDTLARAMGPSLGTALGAPLVIENQAGAGGLLGTQALARAQADGSVISLISPNHAIFPSVLKNVPFHPVNDFTPIALVGTAPLILVAHPKVGVRSARELVTLMKGKPDSLNYASAGNGTLLHLAAAAFVDAAGAKARHIPYKGGSAMLADLLGGQVDFGVIGVPQAGPQIKSGALRALAVMGKQREPSLPDVPTLTELGLPVLLDGWFIVMGPKGMAAADVRRVHTAVTKAMSTPEVREAMAKQSAIVDVSTPEQATSFLREEVARFANIVKNAGVEAQ